MKRTLSIILVLIFASFVTACSGGEKMAGKYKNLPRDFVGKAGVEYDGEYSLLDEPGNTVYVRLIENEPIEEQEVLALTTARNTDYINDGVVMEPAVYEYGYGYDSNLECGQYKSAFGVTWCPEQGYVESVRTNHISDFGPEGYIEKFGPRPHGAEGYIEKFGTRLHGGEGYFENFGYETHGEEGYVEKFGPRVHGDEGYFENFGYETHGAEGYVEKFGARYHGDEGYFEVFGYRDHENETGYIENFGARDHGDEGYFEVFGYENHERETGYIENFGARDHGDEGYFEVFGYRDHEAETGYIENFGARLHGAEGYVEKFGNAMNGVQKFSSLDGVDSELREIFGTEKYRPRPVRVVRHESDVDSDVLFFILGAAVVGLAIGV